MRTARKKTEFQDKLSSLQRELADAKRTIKALITGKVDAVIDTKSAAPVLLAQAQHALSIAEEQFRAVFNSTLDAIVIADNRGKCVDANHAARKLLHIVADDLKKLSVGVFLYRRGGKNFLMKWQRFRAAGRQTGEIELIAPDRSVRHIVFNGVADFLPNRHLLVLRDETERVRSEAAVKAMTHKLENALKTNRRFMDQSPDVICLVNEAGCFIEVNYAAEKVWGYTPRQLIGRPYMELVHPEDRPKTERVAKELMTQGFLTGFENRYIHKDGSLVDMMWSVYWSSEDKIYFCIVRDMREYRRMESQLRDAQKIEAIGVLAGGIAHDFNNVMTIINGRSQLILSKLHEGDKIIRDVELIRAAGERAAKLTRQLLAFSRKQELKPKTINLNTVVTELRMMLKRLIREDIELREELAAELQFARADPSQIEQVLINLVVNARDAMPGGGQLTIRTSNAKLDESFFNRHPTLQPGPFVCISVRDTGVGMPPEVRAHIFEPFFTTKKVGEGSGLGLAMVHGTIKQSSGAIEVQTEPGKGTEFLIYLPARKSADKSDAEAPVSIPPVRGNETLLVVEDEEDLREYMCEVLKSAGYNVVQAVNGEEGLKLIGDAEAAKEPIDLLITDMIMPRMGGAELVRKASIFNHGLRVLYMTGYAGPASNSILSKNGIFILKPFTPTELLIKVREAIESAANPAS